MFCDISRLPEIHKCKNLFFQSESFFAEFVNVLKLFIG